MLHVDPKQAVIDHVKSGRRRLSRGHVLSDQAERIVKQPVGKTLSSAVISGVAQIVEAIMLAVLGVVIYYAHVIDGRTGFYMLVILGAVTAMNVALNIAQTHNLGAYRYSFRQYGRVLAAWSVVFVGLMVGAYLFKVSDLVSRGWLIGWYFFGAIALVLYRTVLHLLVRRWTTAGRLKRRTVIVGAGIESTALIEDIKNGEDGDIELFGLFDDRVDKRSPEEVAGCPKLGTVDDLVEFARRTRVDLVIVAMPLSAETRVLAMLKKLWVLPVDIRLSAHMSKLRFTPRAYSYVGNVAVFDMADRPISDWNLVFKWVFDKVVAVIALVLLSPVMVVTAIAIKLESKGPVIFQQRRHGFNNKYINIFKFRSMYSEMADPDAKKQVTKDDPRVTKVGRFIRKTSIDELPQLFNVLMNELSIVGPRPHALQAKAANKLYNEAVDGYFARHKVKPGMTGWAQIHGWRGETDTVDKIMQRVSHDLYYIENWTPFLDFYIVAMTPISLISKTENAY